VEAGTSKYLPMTYFSLPVPEVKCCFVEISNGIDHRPVKQANF